MSVTPTTKDRTPVLTRRVAFKLNDAEIASKGQALAKGWKEIEDEEEHIKQATKSAKAHLEAKMPALSLLRREVVTGTEERVVDCYREADLGGRCWRVFRVDTDENVDNVSMTKDELDEFRQMDLIDKLAEEKSKNAPKPLPPLAAADDSKDDDGSEDDDVDQTADDA